MTNAHEFTLRLQDLLARERVAMAEFLVAVADFDRRALWVDLGYASLFDYLHRELGLSKASTFLRVRAAGLIQKVPEVLEPLRDGRLCLSSMGELSKVLTPETKDEVLPRFFHLSKREAKAVAAEIRPAEAPPRRDVVTTLHAPAEAPGSSSPPLATRHPPRQPRFHSEWFVRTNWLRPRPRSPQSRRAPPCRPLRPRPPSSRSPRS